MTDEEKKFMAERFGNGKGNEKELEEYKKLSDDLREFYRQACKLHPEWIHAQLLIFTWLHGSIFSNVVV